MSIVIIYMLVARRRAGCRQSQLQSRAGHIGIDAGAGARNERRAEDDGRHHPRARCQRQPERQSFPRSHLGRGVGRLGDRSRHLCRRMAHYPHARDAHHEDGYRPGLCCAGRRRGGHPGFLSFRLSALNDTRDLGRDHGRRSRQATLSRALGRRAKHRRGMDAHAARRGAVRCGSLVASACARPRRTRAARNRAGRARCAGGAGPRAPPAGRRACAGRPGRSVAGPRPRNSRLARSSTSQRSARR